jgi:hypothetical protein
MAKVQASASAGTMSLRAYSTGDLVEVLCDHNRGGDRVRDWLQGVVVQADDKMLAVQFLDDVYLTDGWMVPDRVLWCRQRAENIRPSSRRRMARRRTRKR